MVDTRQRRDPGASACGREGGGKLRRPWVGPIGRFGTKIHAPSTPWATRPGIVVTEGQEADVAQAEPTIRAAHLSAYMGDKGYDSDQVVKVAERGAKAIIPPKQDHKAARDYDNHIYQDCTKVEWFFHLLKRYRRVATRDEKTKRNFSSF